MLIIMLLGLFSFSEAQVVRRDSSFSEDGSLMTNISSGAMYSYSMDVLPNGNIVVGGHQPLTLKVNIYNSNGDSIGTNEPIPGNVWMGVTSVVKALPDGKFLCNHGYSELCRYLPDGTLDTTFGTNACAPLHGVEIVDIAISPNGTIYGAGRMEGSDSSAVVAFLENGVPDSSFSGAGILRYLESGIEFFYCIELQSDGRLLVSGFSFFEHKVRPASLLRIYPNGQLDSTFGVNGRVLDSFTGISESYALGVQQDQKIVMGGYTLPPYMASVARYLPNGERDPAFGDNGVVYLPIGSEVLDLTIRPDGKLLLLMLGEVLSIISGAIMVQLNPDGSIDQTFGTGGFFYSTITPVQAPFTMVEVGSNKIITATSSRLPSSYDKLIIQQFILDFNVGVLQPNNTLDEAQVLLYPNPVSQNIQLQFELQTPEILDIQLMDLSGKILQTVHQHQRFEAGKQEVSIPVSDALPAGTYLLTIAGQGKVMRSVRWVKG